MKSKKAVMSASFIVGTMITLVAFVVIAGTVTRFMGGFEDKEAEILCRDSIALRAASAIGTDIGEFKLAPLLCRTIDKKMKGDKEEITEQVAESIARCWWMFHEGRYEEILEGGFESILPEFEAQNDCFMCYAAMVEKNDDWDSISQIELSKYLMNNNYSKANLPYLDYIQNYVYGGPGRVVMFGDVKPGHAYGISFAAKNTDPDNFLLEIGAVVGGVAVAGAGVALTVLSGGFGTPVGIVMIKAGVGIILLGTATAMIGGAYLTEDMIKLIYREREVSTIYLGDLKTAQEMCFKGDIAGE